MKLLGSDQVQIVIDGPRHQTHRIAESLDVYATFAFGIETMRSLIVPDRIHSRLEAGAWFLVAVPECYRDALLPIIERVFAEHRGLKLTENSVYAFIVHLNSEIWRSLEPVMP